MNWSAHLKIASISGATLGLFIGHLDLAIRVFAKKIEWFEVYQAILLPAAFFLLLFLLVGSAAQIFLSLSGKVIDEDQLRYSYLMSSISLLLLVALYLVAHQLLYGDLLLWDPKRFHANTAIFFSYLILQMVLLAKGKEGLKNLFQRLRRSKLATLFSNYLFILSFFLFSLFAYDIYILTNMPERPMQAKSSNKEAPNVILITLDTVRADHMSLYGYQKETTPNIDRFAEQGAVFEKVSATTSWTLPSHASIFTGKYTLNHGASEIHQKLLSEEETLAEILSSLGYRTAGFISGPYCKAKYGLSQGFQLYHDRLDYIEYRHTYDPISIKRVLDFLSKDLREFILGNDGERKAPEMNRDVFSWLERQGEDPFFLFLNYFDAHDPYDQGLEYRSLFTKESRDDDLINEMVRSYYFDPVQRYQVRSVSEELRDYLVAMYDTELYFLDKHIGELFAKLSELGLDKNTIVIITSDHGEEFFEHGGVMHKQTLYEEVLHVPLIISYPGKLQPQRIVKRASLVDIFPTLLNLLGIEARQGIDGVDLFTQQQRDQRDYVLAERYARPEHGESHLNAVTGDRWKYIEVEPEQERMPTGLYDLKNDPGEQQNLIEREGDQASTMRERIEGYKQ